MECRSTSAAVITSAARRSSSRVVSGVLSLSAPALSPSAARSSLSSPVQRWRSRAHRAKRATSSRDMRQRPRSAKPLESTETTSRRRQPSWGRWRRRRSQAPSGRALRRSPAAGSMGRSYSAKTRRARPRYGDTCLNVTAKSDGRNEGSSVKRCLICRAMARNWPSRSAALPVTTFAVCAETSPLCSICASGNSLRSLS